LAGVGFEAYAEQLPAVIKSQIIQRQVVFPTAEAMIGLVQAGKIRAIGAAEALPVYVRNQVTHGAKPSTL
jgi:tRNA threonylcarbamoyladenosine biosynthesis protein TsaB